MSWVNDKQNIVRDYLMIDELFTRPMSLVEMPKRDTEHGRGVTALEEALDNAFFNINVKGGITKYKSPDDCPVDYLAMLAIEHGVHGWYRDESTEQRRKTIKESKRIHRKAGTITGLSEAIESLGLNVAVAASAVPYTLTLVSSTVLTPENTKAVSDRVQIYKSERDHLYIESKTPTEAIRFTARPSLVRASYYSKTQVSK